MYIRFVSILSLIAASTVVSAQAPSDSILPELLRPIVDIQVISLSPVQQNSDPVNELNLLTSRYLAANNNFQQDLIFYASLREAAQKSNITRWLHEFLVRKQISARQQVTRPRRSENEFEDVAGLTINNISFSKADLFAPSIDDPVYHTPEGLEKIGTMLHFSTRQRIINNNLLFRTGDKTDPFTLSDNERLLRQLPYLEDARIYVVEDKFHEGYADIVVVTKDRWSRGFDMDISDIDAGRIELYDRNVLGFGQDFQANLLFDGKEDNMFGYEAKIKLNNINGKFINAGINYLNAFGNDVFNIHSGREFLTPSMKFAGGVMITAAKILDDFNFPDTSFVNHRLNYNEYDYWIGRSFLLTNDETNTRRSIYVTSRYNRHIFFARPEIKENVRHIFHNRDMFLANITLARVGYLKSNYIYGFGPTEDIPTGTRLETTFGYEDNQFFPRWYTGLSITQSSFIEGIAWLTSSLSVGGFINSGIREQGVLKLETGGFSSLYSLGKFYLRQFVSLDYTMGIKRFEDEFVSISNRYGIRGMISNDLRGKQKLTMQTETMLYAKNNWYGFRYAFYAMADLGWIGQGERSIFRNSFYSGFGIGMRVRNEHLIFPTLQIRLAFFPRVPESASTSLFYLMTERKVILDDFRVRAPDLLPYR